MSNKPWLLHYPADVPVDITTSKNQSIPDMLVQAATQFRARPAFCHRGQAMTYGELQTRATQFAGFLQSLGLRKGDRIALMLPNVFAYPITLYGALMAGLVVVNVNPLYTVPELIHQLQDSTPSAIVVIENFASTLEHAMASVRVPHVVVARIGDGHPCISRWLINMVVKRVKRLVPSYCLPGAVMLHHALRANKSFAPIALTGNDLAFLQYTGGTTGVAKGAMLSHYNVLANVDQVYAWVHSVFEPGKEVLLTALPLYHIFALMVNALLSVKLGANSILITNPRDMAGLVKEIRTYRLTVITGVNILFNGLMNNAAFCRLNFSSLKLCLGGGAAVQAAVAERWLAVTGKPLLEGYGLTEASPVVAVNPMTLLTHDGTIGFPLPSTEVDVWHDDGSSCAVDEPGELVVKGPQVMQGYWQQPEETARVLKNGWLLTGDIAVLESSGKLRIVDRKKDMIIVNGFNVYPNEIEAVIAAMPGVSAVAVVGIPDPVRGEEVRAFVVKRDLSLTAEAVIAHCHASLTGYKVPRSVVFVDQLPTSVIGKVLRKNLRG